MWLSELSSRFNEEREVLKSMRYTKHELNKLADHEKEFLRQRFKELRLAPFDDVLNEIIKKSKDKDPLNGMVRYQYFGLFMRISLANFMKNQKEFYIKLTKERILKIEIDKTIVVSFQNYNKELRKFELRYVVGEFEDIEEAKNFIYKTYQTDVIEVFYKIKEGKF